VVSIQGLRRNTGAFTLRKYAETGEYFRSFKFLTDDLHRF
jgi:hypothetical protein